MPATNPNRADAEALFFEGNRCMKAGDDKRAEECFRNAVRIAPEIAQGHANLGLLLDKRGMVEEAEICYRHSIELDST
ncbi:MAG TPA: tetratricopeptide repeat protein, partial [Rhodocyclaceae bacterium]|nr:tetratricopeptide repeat protein [Rhodocyclaceae bacterium]